METAVFANGRLYDFGNYPMLVESGEQSVKGMFIVVDVEYYDAIMARLDGLEGYDPAHFEDSEYVRVERDVLLENGRKQTAWVYVGNLRFEPTLPIVKDGDWATYIAHKKDDIHEWWQSINTVSGLHGDNSGKQIMDNE